MTAMITKAEKDYALLLCMEFFRDELQWSKPTTRQQEKFTTLRDLCDEALGHPSVADADRIRKQKVGLVETSQAATNR